MQFQDDNELHIKMFFNIIWQVPETGGVFFMRNKFKIFTSVQTNSKCAFHELYKFILVQDWATIHDQQA